MKLPVDSAGGVTLVGGGQIGADDLTEALSLAPLLVAADGGGNALASAGHVPAHVIGDMDSLSTTLQEAWADRLVRISEQDSTDFDKALRSITAPLILALGFTGARLDHTLAAMTTLVQFPAKRVILLGEQDICCVAPPRIALDLAPGARVSLYPLAPVAGRSKGLHWPIDGLTMAPHMRVGTSNHTDSGQVEIESDAPAMLLLLERQYLAHCATQLARAPNWPA